MAGWGWVGMAVLLQQRNGLGDLMRNSLLFLFLFYRLHDTPMNFGLLCFSHKYLTMAVSQLYAHFLICMCVCEYTGGRGDGGMERARTKNPTEKEAGFI